MEYPIQVKESGDNTDAEPFKRTK